MLTLECVLFLLGIHAYTYIMYTTIHRDEYMHIHISNSVISCDMRCNLCLTMEIALSQNEYNSVQLF